MLAGATFALAVPFAGIERPAGAQPEPKKLDRKAPPVVAELVGQLGERRASGPLGIALNGDYAYLAAWRHGLRVVNISNTKEPKEVTDCRIEGAAKGVAVSGGYAFVAAQEGGLRILDVTRPASPKEVGSCRTQGDASAVVVAG